MYPINLQNLKIDEIFEEINEELKYFKIYFVKKLKFDINEIISINYNKTMNKIKKESINYNIKEVENNLNNINNNEEKNKEILEILSFNKKKKKIAIHNNYINDVKDNSDNINIDDKDINKEENINKYRNRINLIYI